MPTHAINASSIARGMGRLGSSSGSAALPSTSSCAGLSYGGSRGPGSQACSASSTNGSLLTMRSARTKVTPTMARHLGVSSCERARQAETSLRESARSVRYALRNASGQPSFVWRRLLPFRRLLNFSALTANYLSAATLTLGHRLVSGGHAHVAHPGSAGATSRAAHKG
jgi:hypothetical protein